MGGVVIFGSLRCFFISLSQVWAQLHFRQKPREFGDFSQGHFSQAVFLLASLCSNSQKLPLPLPRAWLIVRYSEHQGSRLC